ncbi:hypothetical protein METY_3429 [Methylopila sp. Yamaguchi]|nr:hypothetical protein METY_3429 [Methylopila sp. Yamaguchi]
MKEEAQTFAEEGKVQGAERLKSVADTVDRVADQVEEQSPAMADWVRKAAGELESVSRRLKDKSIGDLLTMGQDFARREPAAFIAASAVAGFALSRLLKSTSSAPASSITPVGATSPTPPPLAPRAAPAPVATSVGGLSPAASRTSSVGGGSASTPSALNDRAPDNRASQTGGPSV